MARTLISRSLLYELQEHLTGWTLVEIRGLFDSADIPLCEGYEPNTSGQRRTLAAKYLRSVDPAKPDDACRVLRAFELVLARLEEMAADEGSRKTLERLVRLLRRDGFEYKYGRIVSADKVASLPHLVNLAASAELPYLLRQLERIESAIDDEDPWLAIGTAKEMVETTCKTILNDRGKWYDKNWDLMALFKEARKELRLAPDDVHDEAKAAVAIKRLLSNLATIVQGLAELRNPYGTGHGPDGRAKGLHTRHARLAAGAASTLALFLLETHRDRQAQEEKK